MHALMSVISFNGDHEIINTCIREQNIRLNLSDNIKEN